MIGLFTKSHIYRAALRTIDNSLTVESLMTHEVFAGHPEDEFEAVVSPMVPRLPVVDHDNKVVGMLTQGDIANAFFNSYQTISSELMLSSILPITLSYQSTRTGTSSLLTGRPRCFGSKGRGSNRQAHFGCGSNRDCWTSCAKARRNCCRR